MRNYKDGGEAIVEAYRRLGIDYIMASPGSEMAPIWEALAQQDADGIDGPTYIDCQHETLAVDMAIGYTAVTGRCQAVLLHTGIGFLQGSLGVHNAQLTETPMVVTVGEVSSYGEDPAFDPGYHWYRTLSVVGSPGRLADPVAKWSQHITSPRTLYESVVRAGEMAQRPPLGPTFLSVPMEIMLHEWEQPAHMRNVPPPPKPQPSAEDVERLAKQLVQSRNPLIVTEAVGRSAAAYDALVALAELLSIPVVEGYGTEAANFPKDHPLHQGFDVSPFLETTDLALAIRSPAPWYPPGNRPMNATVVAIDENPLKTHSVYQNVQADSYLEGDVAATLRLLAEAVGRLGVDKGMVAERLERLTAQHDALQESYRKAEEEARDKSPIDPVHLCAAISAAMPDDTAYVSETILHTGLLRKHIAWKGKQTYFHSVGGLGQGLGTALGVKLAKQDSPVVALMGDGSFLYNPVTQSLGLARDADLPILIVVFNNKGYQAMKGGYRRHYPEGTALSQNNIRGVNINGPDYAELVQPFGGFGRKVEDPAELPGALADGLAAVRDGKTAILNVVLAW